MLERAESSAEPSPLEDGAVLKPKKSRPCGRLFLFGCSAYSMI
jgi:hypothetical protein